MQITITKGSDRDWLTVERADGSVERSTFPKKGAIPHDAVHVFAERGMGLMRGFWGHIAEGHGFDAIQEIAKAAGHASAKRAVAPDASIIQLLQAERLVECLEAAQWSGGFDAALLRAAWQAGCDQSHVPLPDYRDSKMIEVYDQIAQFATHWRVLATGESVTFEWNDGAIAL